MTNPIICSPVVRRACSVLLVAAAIAGLAMSSEGAVAADRDCGDFSTQRKAQRFFLKQGGPRSDPHRLDADNDGVACEQNPCPCSRRKRLAAPRSDAVAVRLYWSPRAGA
jgi:hypothetical protein